MNNKKAPAEAGGLRHLTRLSMTSIDVRIRIPLAVGVELLYMAVSRHLYHMTDIPFAAIEIARTPPRLAAALIQWILMADVIAKRARNLESLRDIWCVSGLGLVFICELVSHAGPATNLESYLLVITAIPVALQEEVFYRGILQTTLVRLLGVAPGVITTAVLFTLYHVGVTSPTFHNYSSILLAALILGIIYLKTNSLLAVIIYHSIDDAVLSLPRLFDQPPAALRMAMLAVATGLFVKWAWTRPTE